jgi:hypothetical protein
LNEKVAARSRKPRIRPWGSVTSGGRSVGIVRARTEDTVFSLLLLLLLLHSPFLGSRQVTAGVETAAEFIEIHCDSYINIHHHKPVGLVVETCFSCEVQF